jgi:radical SAM protein with 4Fe4S-binding SPASM domain
MMASPDFKKAPLLVIWEVTRACALACRHCRASAEDQRHPRELSTAQGKQLIEQVREMGTPIMVLTGGDPLQRDDLEELVAHGRRTGLIMATIPAATPRLTRERILALKEAGLNQVAFSLDGPNAASHDDLRKVEGTFERVMQGAAWAREAGIPLQINSVFGAWNINDFDAMAALVERLGAVFWEVFLLVPVGRGVVLPGLTAGECEELLAKLCRLSERAPFVVKVTEGQQYRRYVLQHFGGKPLRLGLSPHTVNAGRGFCFVDHVGDVSPSGFMPIACGNVRDDGVARVYRASPVFNELRDTSLLKGRCGRCPYRELCTGGSRARAHALTGDYLAEDPWCAYEPVAAR